MTLTDLCDQGYLSITATTADPYVAFGTTPTVTSNLMDHIVIKYRTETTAKSGELFTARTDGVTWGSPHEKSHVTWDWVADGEWQIMVIDATSVWGNVYGVTLENLRFDPLEQPAEAGETIDVAYIKFFANAKAARAFADTEYKADGDRVVVRPPLRPLDPATVVPVVLLEGEQLSVSGGIQMNDARYSYERGCVTLTVKGSDPGYFLFREPAKIAPFMTVKYRTTTRGAGGEIYTGSVQSSPNGRTDRLQYDYIPDGQWHTAIIDLRDIADYDAGTNTVKYLRFDFLHSDSGLSSAAAIDIECIAFFATPDEAAVYRHTPPAERTLHTATFVVNGLALYKVEFRAGDESLSEPVVPILPGMSGAWESYTLGDADITVHAIYTPTADTSVPDVPPLTDGSTETNEPDGTEEPAPVTDPAPTDTTPAEGKGCGSTLGISLLTLLLAAALWLGKREDRV